MKEHDWAKLYADADKFMKKVGGTDFNVKTNLYLTYMLRIEKINAED